MGSTLSRSSCIAAQAIATDKPGGFTTPFTDQTKSGQETLPAFINQESSTPHLFRLFTLAASSLNIEN